MMERMTRWGTVAIAGAVMVAACGSHAMTVEDVPLGSEVAITRDDGGVVEGTLAERTAESVTVNQGKAVRAVPRAAIADVQVVTPETPAVLPPLAQFREVTVPAGTEISAELVTSLDTSSTRTGDVVEATVNEPIAVDGETVIPKGSHLHGDVTAAEQSGKVKGRASLSVKFDSLTVEGHDGTYPVALVLNRVAPSSKGDDAKKIGIPAAGGAIIGGILGGKKGALIGVAIGAGAGTAAVLTTSGKEVELPAGSMLHLTLKAPLEIKVPIEKQQ